MKPCDVRIRAIFAFLILCGPVACSSRQVPTWQWDRLFQEADVVLIVEATDAIDSNEKVNDTVFGQFLGVNTTLKVNRAIKGDPGSVVTVLHYRLAKIDNPEARDP